MIHLNNYYNRIRIHITSKKLFNFLIFNGKNHVFAILELNNISFLIEKGGYNLREKANKKRKEAAYRPIHITYISYYIFFAGQ